MKVEVGQKVYSILHGLGVIAEVYAYPAKVGLVSVQFKDIQCDYWTSGKWNARDANPTLLTLEEARAKGYDVPTQRVTKTLDRWVAVFSNSDGTYHTRALGEQLPHEIGKEVAITKMSGTFEVEE